MLNFKIRLYMVADEDAWPELVTPVFCQTRDTYAELRLRLEKGACVDWPFRFWDLDERYRIPPKFEAMNPMCEKVHVIPEEEEAGEQRPKQSRLQNAGETASNDVLAPPELEFLAVEVDDLEVGVTTTVEETELHAEVHSTAVPEDDESMLQSKLISTDIMDNYKRVAMELRKDLAAMDFSDQLKSYDHIGAAVVRIHCPFFQF